MKNLFFLPLVSALLFLGCPDNGVQPKTNPLHLNVQDINCTEAFLKLSLDKSETNRTVSLKRNDSMVVTMVLVNDSMFVDHGLLPNQTYTYTLITNGWNVTTQVTTIDTTSHEVQWHAPDTLGVQGLIRDVWAFSRDNAWAVGEIYKADSTGKPDMGNPYNAAHWDGSKWELRQILVRDFGTGTGYYPLYAMFAFGPDDIWFASAADFIHWDGIQFTSKAFFMIQIPFDGQVRKIWGTGENNLYCVGNTGAIYHYTGSGNWTKQESHTTVDLQDIWGIDDTHIWATGTTVSDGHSVLLQFDGKQWSTLYDSNTEPFQTKFQFSTLWTNSPLRLYLSGGSGLHVMNLNTLSVGSQINTEQSYVSYCIRGTQGNDIFNSGQASELTHSNGYSWQLYSEINTLNNGFAWFYKVHPTNDFVLIGGLYLTELNGFPVVVRGYR